MALRKNELDRLARAGGWKPPKRRKSDAAGIRMCVWLLGGILGVVLLAFWGAPGPVFIVLAVCMLGLLPWALTGEFPEDWWSPGKGGGE